MPPKVSALVTEVRLQFPLDDANAIVENWIKKVIPTAVGAASAVAEIQVGSPQPNQGVIEALDLLQSLQVGVVADIQTLLSTIGTRIPEMKEEDNLGVAVQVAVIKQLTALETELLGGDKSVGATINYKVSYFSSRGGVEEKLNPSGKDAQPSQAPSLQLQLRQIDNDAIIGARLAFLKLASSLRVLSVAVIENSKKLINPRNVNDRMVS